MSRQEGLAIAENVLFSFLLFAAWVKLLEHLTAFRSIYRFIVMLEMMAKALVGVVAILFLILATFTSAEYVSNNRS